jgi:hypothetical protein
MRVAVVALATFVVLIVNWLYPFTGAFARDYAYPVE